MFTIQRKLVYQAINRTWVPLDADNSLTENRKSEVIKLTDKDYE